MASYAEVTKHNTYYRDTDSDQLRGVKPIFILESDVPGNSKADEVKNPKTTICVALSFIYDNIMHLIIILTTKIK
jgi:hypothetical protein